MKAQCPVCGVLGSVQQIGNSVRIGHYVGFKHGTSIIQWHSVGKDFLVKNGKELMVKNKAENGIVSEKDICGRSLAWLGHQVPNVKSLDKLNWVSFKQWLESKYSKGYVSGVYAYSRKHIDCFYDVSKIASIPKTNADNIIDALTALSKYIGCYEQFKQQLKNYDIKRHKQNCIESFMRILSASDSDILDWYEKAIAALRPNEQLFLKFAKSIGARKEECINSFNLIIQLQKENKLAEYYNKELSCLMHFKYGKLFLRGKKNLFISFITENFVNEIANSQSVTYPAIRKRLNHNQLKVRISELRDYYGTYLLQHGILEQEVNLLQGRIPASVFCKHYWSPKLKELSEKVLDSTTKMEMAITN